MMLVLPQLRLVLPQLRLVSPNLNLLAPNKLVVLLQSSPHFHLQVKNQLVGKFHQLGIILIK
jgi:hypothetical protein